MTLLELREKIGALAKAQVAVAEQYPDYAIPADVLETVTQRDKEIAGLADEYKKLEANAAIFKTAGEANDFFNKAAGHPLFPGVTPGAAGEQRTRQTLGEQFVNDPQYKAWLASVAPNGEIPDSRKGIQSPVFTAKALITGASDTSAGAAVFNDVQAGIVNPGRRPLGIRDVITNGTTNSDTVEYVRVTTETNAAAPVAEATATAGASGTKPESAVAMEKVTAPVKTVATWIPATKRALSDAGQLRTYIDGFLRNAVEEELEDQIIMGDGTGENFVGLNSTSGVQLQAYDATAPALLTTTRKARTKVKTVGRDTPNAWLMHPTDWELFDLLTNADTNYYFGGPLDLGTPRLWGLPVIESEAVTAGYAWVGNFKQAVLWDREQVSITVSDSHADFFIRNMVAILAELRAAFGVLRPKSFVKVDLTLA